MLLCACEERAAPREDKPTSAAPSAALTPSVASTPLELLYLPDAGANALPPPIGDGLLPLAPPRPRGRCPQDMVDVRGAFCIDRYEITLVEQSSGEPLSPYYHPTRAQTAASYDRYRKFDSSLMSVPEPPAFQLRDEVEPAARSSADAVPQGYLSGDVAALACQRAGKRLCTHAEWTTACRGERNLRFPYGDVYQEGSCNVFREAHPAGLLHGNASREHLDPRLNLMSGDAGPLLRRTGATPSCRSPWGADAVFDMVGNLDEWVAEGYFVGGFYARATRDGCDAMITVHPSYYFDYSLGARCCR